MREDFGKRLSRIVGQERVNDLKKQANVAAQIIMARHELKWSQQNLANAIGVSKSTIGRIEAGISNPSYPTLLKISKVLKTPLIIDGTEEEEKLMKV